MTRLYNHLHRMLQSPLVIPGVSDAGAHLNMFQDGTSPTNMLSFWARDRVRGPQLPIEYAVRKQARDTAYMTGCSIGARWRWASGRTSTSSTWRP